MTQVLPLEESLAWRWGCGSVYTPATLRVGGGPRLLRRLAGVEPGSAR